MQFPGSIIEYLLLLVLIIIPTHGQYDICYLRGKQESCYVGTFDTPLRSIPEIYVR